MMFLLLAIALLSTLSNADEFCKDGYKSGLACCAKSCGRCGGSGCSRLNGGASKCCTSTSSRWKQCTSTSSTVCRIPEPKDPHKCSATMQGSWFGKGSAVPCCADGDGDICYYYNGDKLKMVKVDADSKQIGQGYVGSAVDTTCDTVRQSYARKTDVGRANYYVTDVQCNFCATGYKSGLACCAKSCGRCGGSGCSRLNGGASKCCLSNIFSSKIQCQSTSSTACIMPALPAPPKPQPATDPCGESHECLELSSQEEGCGCLKLIKQRDGNFPDCLYAAPAGKKPAPEGTTIKSIANMHCTSEETELSFVDRLLEALLE